MEGKKMTKLMLVLMMVMGLAVFGCGEQPDAGSTDGNADSTAVTDGGTVVEDGGNDGHGSSDAAFDLDTPDLAVGQWIEFGADELAETVMISVVDTEINQGTECFWVQISGPGFVAQMLVDPSGLEIALADYQAQMDVFFADPAGYIREHMGDAEQMASMFGNEESMDMALEFVRAIRMIKFDQGGGAIMAIDLAGVPEFLEEQMADPAFQESFQQGFAQGFNAEQGQEGLNEVMDKLDEMEFAFNETTVEAGGGSVNGIEFSVNHPDMQITAVISNELPIIPLAYASINSVTEGESHTIQVRGFGMTGAENLLPGEPAQTIPAMMFLQGMTQQMGGAQEPQGRR